MTPLPIGTKVRCIETSTIWLGRDQVVAGKVYTITDHVGNKEQYGYFLAETAGAYKIERFVPATPILRRQACSMSAS